MLVDLNSGAGSALGPVSRSASTAAHPDYHDRPQEPCSREDVSPHGAARHAINASPAATKLIAHELLLAGTVSRASTVACATAGCREKHTSTARARSGTRGSFT